MRLILRYRKKEEAILTIRIEDYEELNCAKSITSFFNLNITVFEVLNKIARKGNVFIEDASKYILSYPAKRVHELNPGKTLKDYDIQNKVTIIFFNFSKKMKD